MKVAFGSTLSLNRGSGFERYNSEELKKTFKNTVPDWDMDEFTKNVESLKDFMEQDEDYMYAVSIEPGKKERNTLLMKGSYGPYSEFSSEMKIGSMEDLSQRLKAMFMRVKCRKSDR